MYIYMFIYTWYNHYIIEIVMNTGVDQSKVLYIIKLLKDCTSLYSLVSRNFSYCYFCRYFIEFSTTVPNEYPSTHVKYVPFLTN